MANYEQGTAPAILFEGDVPLWQFINRSLECNDKSLHAKLIKNGAICIDGPTKVEAVGPEGFAGLTKPEVIAQIKAIYGIELSMNQSRPDLMAKVAEIVASGVAVTPKVEGNPVGPVVAEESKVEAGDAE